MGLFYFTSKAVQEADNNNTTDMKTIYTFWLQTFHQTPEDYSLLSTLVMVYYAETLRKKNRFE